MAVQHRRESVPRALLRIRQYMRIRVQRRLHVGVPEPLRDDVRRFAAEQQQRRAGVPKCRGT